MKSSHLRKAQRITGFTSAIAAIGLLSAGEEKPVLETTELKTRIENTVFHKDLRKASLQVIPLIESVETSQKFDKQQISALCLGLQRLGLESFRASQMQPLAWRESKDLLEQPFVNAKNAAKKLEPKDSSERELVRRLISMAEPNRSVEK